MSYADDRDHDNTEHVREEYRTLREEDAMTTPGPTCNHCFRPFRKLSGDVYGCAVHGVQEPYRGKPCGCTIVRDPCVTIAFCPTHARIEKQIQQPTLSHDATRCTTWPCVACAEDLLARLAAEPCDHGPQPFCPREEARSLLGRVK